MGKLVLEAGSLRLDLNPGLGGSIATFDWIGESGPCAILRRAENRTDVLAAANFPLVPFVNRVRDGRFRFGDREVVLQPNMPGDPSPLHGQGWLGAWNTEASDTRHASLGFRHEPGEWPWRYEARQQFELDQTGLSLRLTCLNLSSEPMPCGLGQHPYFPCGPETRIDTVVSDVWTIDEKVLPVERIPAEGRFDLRDRPACGQGLDHGFAGWSGSAEISDPQWPYTLRMSSPDATFFQIYSPPDGGIVVVEPVTHANAAMNLPQDRWQAHGLRVLQPGEEMKLDMRLEVRAKPGRAEI